MAVPETLRAFARKPGPSVHTVCMTNKDSFRVDEHIEISVEGDTCSITGALEASFPIASARFVWAEVQPLTLVGWGALRIEVGDEPCTTLALGMSRDQARRLQLFLEQVGEDASLH